jgi:hypothetical protein
MFFHAGTPVVARLQSGIRTCANVISLLGLSAASLFC